MTFSKEIRKITDQLSYNLLYAPDYPGEDCTSLQKEEERIQKWIRDVASSVRREDIGDWIRLSSASVSAAFAKFREKQNGEARKDIEGAIQYLRNALTKKPHRADFIVGPNGTSTAHES